MTTVYDFTDIDEPSFTPVAHVKDGLVGEVPERNEERGYIKRQESADEYGLGNDCLRKLMRHDVKFVYIVEPDTNTVCEFTINSFLTGEEVDQEHRVSKSSSVRNWHDHAYKIINYNS